MQLKRLCCLLLLLCLAHPVSYARLSSSLGDNLGYYQDPALRAQSLVFVSQGDLWLSKLDGESADTAARLTSHPNIERDPHFSPDGELIAYVSDYANVPAVYLISKTGSASKQVTFEAGNTKLHGFIDNTRILYSTVGNAGAHNSWILKTVDIDTLQTQVLPLSDAVEGVILQKNSSTGAGTVFFTQFGLQVSSDNANFYKGGGKGELWSFDLSQIGKAGAEAVNLTKAHEGSVRAPMLHNLPNKERLFFLSNDAGLDNIYSMKFDGSDVIQHTDFDNWAVREPYLDNGLIVFQHGADIKQYNVASGAISTIELRLQSDFANLQSRYLSEPLKYLDSISLSNDGTMVALTARGKANIAHTDGRRLVQVASDPRSRIRASTLSHDGKSVYAISDESGEYEIWRLSADGSSAREPLTSDGSIRRTGLWLSPNSEHLLHTDKSGKLFALKLSNGKNRLLLDDLSSGFLDNIAFSPDSRFISFAYQQRHSERPQIILYDLNKDTFEVLSSAKYSSYSPTFSSDGHWLYFLSDRAFQASPGNPWGDRNMGQVFDKRTQVFAFALNEDTHFPFAPPNELNRPTSNDSDKDDDVEVEVDWDGLQSRLWQIDTPAGNFNRLNAGREALFVLDQVDSGKSHLKTIALEHDAKLETYAKDVESFQLSTNREVLLIQTGRRENSKFTVVDANVPYPKSPQDFALDLSKWRIKVEPKAEWQQMFKDAWLMHRDGLFDANMRGIDWPSVKQKYMPLVNRISSRDELNDIFKQMMGELNALHSQVRGGDILKNENAPNMSTLGAVYRETDDQSGVLVAQIYQHDAELISQSPPLSMPGVDVKNGDIITAINGQSIRSIAQLQLALLNQAGQQVLLDIKRKRKSHQVVVVPQNLQMETRYRYNDWVVSNAREVNAISSNIGYLHLYAMGPRDLSNFAREFYAQYNKPALIIDVRRNRGGNIDSVIIEKLLRRAWSFWQSPNGEKQTNMQQTFRGHLVVLADQFTYSDGETFTAGIKALYLGTVIGKQTAGAGVWLSGGNNVVDGGIARVAEFPVYDMQGNWITEGRGISPDIEVDNLPHASFLGNDAQLEAAIEYLQKKMQTQPIPAFNAKPFPDVATPAGDVQ
ncbi:S41 family peptidase [Ningiella sp. W23]|uniref:S41 family peptidase n=1 Tax=Ningiella sp. W23 TaxID=3023715 RepID=UPI00375743DB